MFYPCLRPEQCSIPKWDIHHVFMTFISSIVLGFLLLVLSPARLIKEELSSTFFSSLPFKDEVEKLFKWPFVLTTVPRRFLYTALTSVIFLKDYGVKRSLNLESCIAGKGF